MTREQQLERALRAAIMEPGPVSTAHGLKLLGLDQYGNPVDNEPTWCGCCGRVKTNHYGALCGACSRSD